MTTNGDPAARRGFFLTLPTADDSTLRSLVRKLRLLVLRELLEPSVPLPSGLATAMRRIAPVVARCARDAPSAALEAVGSPDVMASVLSLRSGLITPEAALDRAVPQLLMGLANAGIQGREAMLWDRPIAGVSSAAAGWAVELQPPAEGLLVHAAGAELRLSDGTLFELEGDVVARARAAGHASSAPFHALDGLGPGVFSELDGNPLAMVELHPDKHGNRCDLGGRSVAEWTASLEQALGLVRLGLPTLADELRLSLLRIVPVGYEPQLHLSASYREAPGLIYLTLHPSSLTLAEAIVHETQHGKLNALSWFDPVLHNGHTEWTASPVRPDLRPLMGVLLAVHAFVPVAALHAALAELDWPGSRTPEFAERRLQVLQANAAGLQSLSARARPTVLGQRLLDDLQRLHAQCAAGVDLGAAAARDATELG